MYYLNTGNFIYILKFFEKMKSLYDKIMKGVWVGFIVLETAVVGFGIYIGAYKMIDKWSYNSKVLNQYIQYYDKNNNGTIDDGIESQNMVNDIKKYNGDIEYKIYSSGIFSFKIKSEIDISPSLMEEILKKKGVLK